MHGSAFASPNYAARYYVTLRTYLFPLEVQTRYFAILWRDGGSGLYYTKNDISKPRHVDFEWNCILLCGNKVGVCVDSCRAAGGRRVLPSAPDLLVQSW